MISKFLLTAGADLRFFRGEGDFKNFRSFFRSAKLISHLFQSTKNLRDRQAIEKTVQKFFFEKTVQKSDFFGKMIPKKWRSFAARFFLKISIYWRLWKKFRVCQTKMDILKQYVGGGSLWVGRGSNPRGREPPSPD